MRCEPLPGWKGCLAELTLGCGSRCRAGFSDLKERDVVDFDFVVGLILWGICYHFLPYNCALKQIIVFR